MSNFLAYSNLKSTIKRIPFDVEIKVFENYYYFLNDIKLLRFILLVTLNISLISKKSYLVGALRSKEIDTLHNVNSFSKRSHRHFSLNITKFSEQHSLTPF